MKLFVDTANVDEIRQANDMGVICGVTNNPCIEQFAEPTIALNILLLS